MTWEGFYLKKLNKWKLGSSLSLKSHAALESLDDSRKMNMALENVRKNIKISTSLGQCEWKVHEPGFDEEYSIFVDKRKQAKLQWLQNPSHINADYVNN